MFKYVCLIIHGVLHFLLDSIVITLLDNNFYISCVSSQQFFYDQMEGLPWDFMGQ